MKKLLLFGVVVTVISLSAHAQDRSNFRFSVGAELGLPTGGFSNSHSLGIGGTAQAEISLQENLMGTATAGFLVFKGKSIPGLSNANYPEQAIIPVRIGVKYFLTTGIYGALQTGVGFLNNDGGTAFAYSPQIGYEFESKNNKSFDVSIKYDGYAKSGGSIGYFGIRVAKVL
jgi:hypothetical protein